MDQLISKIVVLKHYYGGVNHLFFCIRKEMITYLQFIPRHVHIETILPIIVILHKQILIQIITENLLLNGLLTKYKMLCIILLFIIFSIHRN